MPDTVIFALGTLSGTFIVLTIWAYVERQRECHPTIVHPQSRRQQWRNRRECMIWAAAWIGAHGVLLKRQCAAWRADIVKSRTSEWVYKLRNNSIKDQERAA
jgi:hypothetical protein